MDRAACVPRGYCCIGISSLAVLLSLSLDWTTTRAEADDTVMSQVCQDGNAEDRRLEIVYSGGSVPCSAYYTTATGRKEIAHANHDAEVCEDAVKKTLRRLIASGFRCGAGEMQTISSIRDGADVHPFAYTCNRQYNDSGAVKFHIRLYEVVSKDTSPHFVILVKSTEQDLHNVFSTSDNKEWIKSTYDNLIGNLTKDGWRCAALPSVLFDPNYFELPYDKTIVQSAEALTSYFHEVAPVISNVALKDFVLIPRTAAGGNEASKKLDEFYGFILFTYGGRSYLKVIDSINIDGGFFRYADNELAHAVSADDCVQENLIFIDGLELKTVGYNKQATSAWLTLEGLVDGAPRTLTLTPNFSENGVHFTCAASAK